MSTTTDSKKKSSRALTWLKIIGGFITAIAAIISAFFLVADKFFGEDFFLEPTIYDVRLAEYEDNSFSESIVDRGAYDKVVKFGAFFNNPNSNPLRITYSYIGIKSITYVVREDVKYSGFWKQNTLHLYAINDGWENSQPRTVKLEVYYTDYFYHDRSRPVTEKVVRSSATTVSHLEVLEGGEIRRLLSVAFDVDKLLSSGYNGGGLFVCAEEENGVETVLGGFRYDEDYGEIEWIPEGGMPPEDYSTNILLETENAKISKKVPLSVGFGSAPSIDKSEIISVNIVPDKSCKLEFYGVFTASGEKMRTSSVTTTVWVPIWKSFGLIYELYNNGIDDYHVGDDMVIDYKWGYNVKEYFDELNEDLEFWLANRDSE